MVVELVAGRLIARYVGSSLYTWTSVIGIVLAGIAAGNYVGGRLADRYRPREALACLFLVASATCLLVPMLNVHAGNWMFLRSQDWPVRIATHVFLVFFLPSSLLGTIGPVAAKMALDLGRETGRTVGGVYSWGAVGSIVGTFLTGFYLIAQMGTVTVLLSVSAVLLVMALIFGSRWALTYMWIGVVGASFAAALGPWEWAGVVGLRLGLRPYATEWVYFHKESQYSFITVEEEIGIPGAGSDSKKKKGHGKRDVEAEIGTPGVRSMTLDYLIHAYIDMEDPDHLIYEYEEMYAAVTRAATNDWPAERKPRALFLGGGGFVFPRWLLRHWPGSHAEVAEIDPQVTRAAFEAFGLPLDSPMKIFNLDARNHVDDLLQRLDRGHDVGRFDFVYSDAFNHYSPPFHLTTVEFNEKVRRLMRSDGIFLANVIDIYRSGRFVGAMINTIERSYPHVYAVSSAIGGPSDEDARDTFIVVGSLRPLPLNELALEEYPGMLLDPEQLAILRRRSNRLVLTDDFAPVDNLLAPVVRVAEHP
jgi:spermidine synthase